MTDPEGFTDLGWTPTDGLTFAPAPTVTVEVADWIAPLCGGNTLTGGVIEGGMVRFDQPDGAVYIHVTDAKLGRIIGTLVSLDDREAVVDLGDDDQRYVYWISIEEAA